MKQITFASEQEKQLSWWQGAAMTVAIMTLYIVSKKTRQAIDEAADI